MTFTCFDHFNIILLVVFTLESSVFGGFLTFWKNQEIQDGGSKMAAVRTSSSSRVLYVTRNIFGRPGLNRVNFAFKVELSCEILRSIYTRIAR